MHNLKIFWDSVQNATSYNLYYKTSPGVTIANGTPIIGITDIVYHHQDLLPGVTYYYIVVAVDIHGNIGAPSVEFGAITSPPVILDSIAITPINQSIVYPATQQFVAMGTYSDASVVDITSLVTWSSGTPATATINIGGFATSVFHGTSLITATLGPISDNTTLTVTNVLTSIVITPPAPSIVYPNTQQFTATGHYNDGATQNITGSVTWDSATTSVATINGSGLASSVLHGTSLISATIGMISDSTILTVTNILTSITVAPLTPSIAYPATQQFTATGHYNDSSTADLTSTASWSSGTPGTATINSAGLASSVHSGTSLITATLGVSGNTTLTVTHALLSIDVTPHNTTVHFAGNTVQYTAMGTYSDADILNITSVAAWNSSVPGVATIDAYGLATSVAAGNTNITATYSAITSNNAVLSFPSWFAQTGPGVGGDIMSTIYGASDINIIAGGGNSGNPVIWRWDGYSWKTALRGPGSAFSNNNPVNSVKASPSSNVFYAKNIRNIARSYDSGTTWIEGNQPVVGQFVNAIGVVDDSTIWAHCGNNGTNFMKKSTDAGISWSTIFTFPDGNTTINDMHVLGPNDIWAVGNYNGSYGVVWYWNGSSWSQKSPWTSASNAPQSDIFSVWGTSNNDMYVSGTTSFISTPTKSAIVHSTDLFTSYTPQTFGTSIASSTSIFGANNNIYAAVNNGSSAYLVYGYQPGISAANTWGDAGAAHNTGSVGALAVWVSATSDRATSIGGTDIQTNSPVATLVSIAVSPVNPTIYFNGSTRQFTAIGTFSDGYTSDITKSITTWSSTTPATATINANGLVTTVAAGTTNITATIGAVTSPASILTVSTWTGANVPTDIFGLKHWVKADAGITKDGYDSIITWADQSGNSTNWSAGLGSGNVTWIDNQQNSLPIIRSTDTASDNYLQQPAFFFGNSQQAEVFVMIKANSGGGGTNYAWGGFGSDLGNLSHYPFTGVSIYESFGNTTRQGAFNVANSGNATRAYGIYNVSSGSGASTYIVRLNGTQIDSAATGIPGWDSKFRLFAGALNTSFQFIGDIGEVVIFNYVLTANERQGVYDYLQAKWNTPNGV